LTFRGKLFVQPRRHRRRIHRWLRPAPAIQQSASSKRRYRACRGSGRIYKHCCGRAATAHDPDEKRHAGAVERALDWLANRHRNAVGAAIEAMLFAGLTDEERATLETQDDETRPQIPLRRTIAATGGI